MPNFPGSQNALPGVYTNVETFSAGLSLPAGTRTLAIIGEGVRQETLIAQALGGGNDGLDPTYSGVNGRDGRHFLTSYYPLISNRTTLTKNGITLNGTEGTIDGTSFSSFYDYKIDIATGQIELQPAALVDLGGSYYRRNTNNIGDGYINSLQLLDENAPAETWTVKCTSVRRDGGGDPIDGYARFIAVGSVSGNVLDGYGNVVVWMSDGVTASNGILSFNITEGTTAFQEGDRFTIQVSSGVLAVDDSLKITYICEIDLNQPEFFTDLDSLCQKHGEPNLSNRLSLGAQLAFANGTPGVWAVQAAPAIPRRVSYLLEESASGGAAEEDMTFALPVGIVPDANSNINFFVTDPVTDVERQILPNKVAYYDATITASPYAEFIDNPLYTYSYTVILQDAVISEDNDGVIVATLTGCTFTSASVTFTAADVGRTLKLYNGETENDGSFTIVAVTEGAITINNSGMVDDTDVSWQIVDSTVNSAQILFTADLAAELATGSILRGTLIDTRDADFFDAGWLSAYEALETIETDIICPLPSQTISAIFQNGVTHVTKMSNIKMKLERVLFIGAIAGLTPNNVIGTTDAAAEDIGILEGIQGDDVAEILNGNIEDLANYGVQNAYGTSYRVVYFYPDEIVLTINGLNTLVDGFFMAPAAAGWLSGTPNIALPLTKKSLTGFSILRDKVYRPIILENLTAAGITVLQPIAGGGKVVRGQTTTNSGYAEEREVSVVFIRDSIAKQLRLAFDGFVGQAESDILQPSLAARARTALNGYIGQGLITQWRDLKVARDSVDPTQWNITVKVQPTYPVNFIYIRVSVGLL